MGTSITNATALSAWRAQTDQTAQIADLASTWTGDVAVRYYTSGNVLLRTVTHGAWVQSTVSSRRQMALGAIAAESRFSTGTAAYAICAVPGGADILRCDVSLGAAVTDPGGRVNLGTGSGAAGLVVLADAGLRLSPLPTWLEGVAVNQAVEIASTSIRYGQGPGTRLSYSGLANRDTLLVLAATGGHNDCSDNGVDSLDLTANAPTWANRIAPYGSPVASVNYYRTTPTVEPTSRHTYNHVIWSPQRDRMILHGTRSPWGQSGALTPTASNSLNIDTWAWDADTTLPDTGFNVVQDASGYCYGYLNDFAVTEYNPVANTKTSLAGFSGQVAIGPVAYDSTRGTFFACSWGNGQGGGTGHLAWRYAARFASQTAITYNSSAAATALQADTSIDCTMFYVAALDAFFYWTGTTLYKITPNAGTTWDVATVTTTGATLPAPSFSHTRACYSATLGVMAYLPNDTGNLYCVRLV